VLTVARAVYFDKDVSSCRVDNGQSVNFAQSSKSFAGNNVLSRQCFKLFTASGHCLCCTARYRVSGYLLDVIAQVDKEKAQGGRISSDRGTFGKCGCRSE
jgi:hypothetical protein